MRLSATDYDLHRVAKRPSTPKAPTASLPPLPLRLLPGGANQFPGREFHPLKSSAFSRRTVTPTMTSGFPRPSHVKWPAETAPCRRSRSYHVVGLNIRSEAKRWMSPRSTQSSSWRRKLRHTKHWPCSCQKKKSRSTCDERFAQRTTRKGCERPRSSYVNSGLKTRIN